MPKLKGPVPERHKVGLYLYKADIDLVEKLRFLVGIKSRSAIIRMSLRRLLAEVERAGDNAEPQPQKRKQHRKSNTN